MMLSSFSLHRIVSRNSSIVRCLSSSSSPTRLIGRVTSFQRKKAYGFIEAKDSGEVFFVHRQNIVSDLPANQHPFHPYLRRGEVVAFDVAADEAPIIRSSEGNDNAEGGDNDNSNHNTQGHRRALDVTWASGESIPPLRKSYYPGALLRTKEGLGVKVWDIMQDVNLSEEEKLSKIHQGFEEAKHEIESVEAKIRSMGMNVEDFPTDIVRRGEGPKKDSEDEDHTPGSVE